MGVYIMHKFVNMPEEGGIPIRASNKQLDVRHRQCGVFSSFSFGIVESNPIRPFIEENKHTIPGHMT
jgi:hypothetical protein